MTPDSHQRRERTIRRSLPQRQMRKVTGEGDSWDNLSVEFRVKKKNCSTPKIIQSKGAVFKIRKHSLCMIFTLLSRLLTLPNNIYANPMTISAWAILAFPEKNCPSLMPHREWDGFSLLGYVRALCEDFRHFLSSMSIIGHSLCEEFPKILLAASALPEYDREDFAFPDM